MILNCVFLNSLLVGTSFPLIVIYTQYSFSHYFICNFYQDKTVPYHPIDRSFVFPFGSNSHFGQRQKHSWSMREIDCLKMLQVKSLGGKESVSNSWVFKVWYWRKKAAEIRCTIPVNYSELRLNLFLKFKADTGFILKTLSNSLALNLGTSQNIFYLTCIRK